MPGNRFPSVEQVTARNAAPPANASEASRTFSATCRSVPSDRTRQEEDESIEAQGEIEEVVPRVDGGDADPEGEEEARLPREGNRRCRGKAKPAGDGPHSGDRTTERTSSRIAWAVPTDGVPFREDAAAQDGTAARRTSPGSRGHGRRGAPAPARCFSIRSPRGGDAGVGRRRARVPPRAAGCRHERVGDGHPVDRSAAPAPVPVHRRRIPSRIVRRLFCGWLPSESRSG